MTTRADLLHRLAAVVDDLGTIAAPTEARQQLQALCRSARLALDTGSVSVARLEGDTLVYEAADGRGGELIIGTRLPIAQGIAGYVARTGQALIIDQVARDPRFARDVAERVGYVPDSILATPITDSRGDVIGVLSLLDRGRHGNDTLAVASAFADQAALVLPQIDLAIRLAPILFAAVADAVEQTDDDLAGALRRQVALLPDETIELAALLVELRSLSPDARASAVRIVSEFTKFAATVRRRR
jgi:signal transduction protein with GAF and PtsI domain